MYKVLSVVGARPNFMKVGPIHRALSTKKNIESIICHTGQHYDEKMSKVFFEDLEMPKPHIYLGVGGGSHAEQTGKVMIEFEKEVIKLKPDLVLVVGDVNSTLACSIVAKKLHIPVVHVEAGLRSFDREMPEELNRLVTDSISDFFFVTEDSGEKHLLNDGVDPAKIHFTGNVMIDSLVYFKEKASKSKVLEENGLTPGEYLLVTLHRPSNVDSIESLTTLAEILNAVAGKIKIVFPIHPRTLNNLKKNNLSIENENIILLEAQGYLDFLQLMQNSKGLLTDSGGIQEETTFLNIPCLTLRDNTERPVTVDLGTNILLPLDKELILENLEKVISGNWKQGQIPRLWDGKAAERMADIIEDYLSE
jgi:UDP-N-acetylglucosamine 2-epimerase (non-hydrolysing)